ncbi:MAG: methylmalonyl-CoA mutase family protein [Proteobacteria bacterium]|nr:methylmalonyl-CoA mutase family protein [Pseudomonadota bacterium]MDA1331451.1 methylmalonyl-CoA mutase family protein [Pseudomonadota bacterium]
MTNLKDNPLTDPAGIGAKIRFVTAASLFDGHDASINIIRRMLQGSGTEVIHLGHNRSVDEIVTAAVQEDAKGIAVSSYQGGHIEYFKYMIDLLRERGVGHIRVFGGGGGVIVPTEIKELHEYGIAKIYSPEDGATMGLQGMIDDMIQRARKAKSPALVGSLDSISKSAHGELARVISAIEDKSIDSDFYQSILAHAGSLVNKIPVLGITGTGGAGKSSLTDELIRRFRLDEGDNLNIAVIAVDPSRRKTGGALLGDRIRMNALDGVKIYMRSLATRSGGREVADCLPGAIAACKCSGFDLIIIETSGIGQGDAAIVPFVDVSLYVMTPEYGAASQLEKIDMLDFADLVAINKFDRRGAEDALRDVSKQYQRNHQKFNESPSAMPVFGTIASRFNDSGVTALYHTVADALVEHGLVRVGRKLPNVKGKSSTKVTSIIPPDRTRYLAEISNTIRSYKKRVLTESRLARERQQLKSAAAIVKEETNGDVSHIQRLVSDRDHRLHPNSKNLLSNWPKLKNTYSGEHHIVTIREEEIRTELKYQSLSGSLIPRVSLPKFEDEGEILKWLLLENLPGYFPFTGGAFPFKRENEDPTRMFAGEGDAFRTNKRFHLLSKDMLAKRLSTAFDSVTLYGFDPDLRPDIYGKIGNSGVSIATLEDMKVLYSGFDLCAPTNSVSMTINGPAPTILAMFMNTAIDQQFDKFKEQEGREPSEAEKDSIKKQTLSTVRGTVQADILKEDQGQNTCIFSTEFSLKVMGDVQQYFIDQNVRNFYSVSISGYHIAEAGANPISQLAFTLSNGFSFVEAYLARGMKIDDFAPNLSFFFSNGLDPEYTVIGRVARRIWAVAMRDRYGANERSQKLKYHCQTSGRSLHAQEIHFNDIRTTLQALIATYDNANSLHTNAYDEAITTPTEESVRRAMAIQLIINREWGLAKNENSNQGSFIIEELTDLVEESVLKEFDSISERGGVLGAMELGYQRGKIQEESLYYEHKKHDGSHPLIGVNTFRNPNGDTKLEPVDLIRSSEEEKQSQLNRLKAFQEKHSDESAAMLERLQTVVIQNQNVFEVLMDAVRVCSLGQISHALFEVGGKYRRSM